MLVDVPDELIEQCRDWGGDESGYMHIASYVMEEAHTQHPDWFGEEDSPVDKKKK